MAEVDAGVLVKASQDGPLLVGVQPDDLGEGIGEAALRIPVLGKGGCDAGDGTVQAGYSRGMAAFLHLARAAHAGPTLVVTAAVALLARGFGGTLGEVVLVGLAVLAGQLSIGWSNDAIDADRDRSVGRQDKPTVAGAVSVRTLTTAARVALAAAVVLSLALGAGAAAVHLLGGVAMGWAYNLGLKATAVSPAPYAVAFGTLPSVASLAVTERWAPLWLTAAGAAIGVSAHIANTLPDLAEDAATGVRGLPHRLGERPSRWLAAGVLGGAVAVVLLGAGLSTAVLMAVTAAAALSIGFLLIGASSAALPSIMVLVLIILAVVGSRIAG